MLKSGNLLCLIKGRNGLGSIFVFSSGNGGRFGDSCAFDGYVNNIHTIAIGAFSLNDKVPRFSERCSSVLASAYGDNVVCMVIVNFVEFY